MTGLKTIVLTMPIKQKENQHDLSIDDGELTRTRKVRRKIIAEKFEDLINALYDGSTSIHTETEVTYEDGRKGKISATLQIKDATTNTLADLAAQ